MEQEILKIENLYFDYSDTSVLRDVNFTLHKGDFLGIIGANGAGKSTLIKIILKILPYNKGKITLFGLFKRYRKEDYEKLSTVLEKVGMPGYENRLIGNLSGGQQQRIFIARALISEPELLLMDEPTVGVDAKSVRQIMDIISELNKQGMTIIMTNHDTPELVRVSDKLLIFCEHGNGEFVSRNDLTMQQINEIFAGKRVHHHG